MDDSSVDLGEPVSPSSSSSGDSVEDELERSENAGQIEQSMDSTSEGGGTPGLTEMHETEQLDPEHYRRQDPVGSSELGEQNDEDNPPKSPDMADQKSQVNISPSQSSVSEVSSENEEAQSNESFEKERHQDVDERLKESQWQLGQTRLGSPKIEHLDYYSSDGEDDNLEKYNMNIGSSEINLTADSNILDRRKLAQETGEDDSLSQNEDDDVSLKMNIHEKEVDDVSDQSGEESGEGEGLDDDNNNDDQPSASSEGNGISNLPEVIVEKREELDDVSDQSDSELEQPSRSDKDLEESLNEEDAGGVQEDLDDVSEQSDADTGEGDALRPSSETSVKVHQEKELGQGQLEDAGDADLDDVSESEDGEEEQGDESLSQKSKETLHMETPSQESRDSQEAVVDVHHHDELDFEEDVEERDAGGGEEKVPQEVGARVEDEKKETTEEGKLDGLEKKERTEELESGEEGETVEVENKDGEAGELEDDDAEEGEVKDPDDRKVTPRPVCRFFVRGQCTWGTACRFIHPGVNDLGNYSLIDFKEIEENTAKLLNKDLNPPPPPPVEEVPEEDYIMPEPFLPPPPVPEEPPRESVWERGIRQAKEMRKKAERRRELGIQEEPQFVVEETFEDFDMEAEFNPDMNRPRGDPYGYPMEPSPEYNPRREQRGHYYEPRGPPRHDQRQKATRHEPFNEQKFRESRPPRKDQFGRDYTKRQENFQERQTSRGDIPKQYPPPKADRGLQERGRKEERSRTSTVPNTPADAWQDPWARNRSPKPKSKQQGKSRKRSGSLSSGSSVSRSRSRSYSSGSSRSSSASSYSSKSSRSPSPVSRKPKPTKPPGIQARDKGLPAGKKPGTEGGKLGLRKPPGPVDKTPPVKKLGLQPTPQKSAKSLRKSISNSSISSASRSRSRSLSKSPSRTRPRPGIPGKGSSRPRRRRSSSGSSHVSVSSQSSADSDHMYANLASPVSSSSSPERQSKKKTKGGMKQREKFPPSSKIPKTSEPKSSRPKQIVTVPSMEAFREPPVQVKKASKPVHQKTTVDPKSKSTSAPAQMTSRNPVKHTAHKDIKLTLLNKPPAENKKRYEVLGEGAAKKVKPVAPVKPTTKVVVEKERRPVKPLQQSTKKATPSAMVAPVRAAAVKPNPSDRKRPPSPFNQRDQPPAKMAHKTGTSGGGKVRDPAATKKATISRREEILKQLKAVEEMIARKKAKMKN